MNSPLASLKFGDGGEVETLQGFYLGGQTLGDGRGWLSRDAGAIWLGTRQLAVEKTSAEVPLLGLQGILSIPLLQSNQVLHLLLQEDQVKHPTLSDFSEVSRRVLDLGLPSVLHPW